MKSQPISPLKTPFLVNYSTFLDLLVLRVDGPTEFSWQYLLKPDDTLVHSVRRKLGPHICRIVVILSCVLNISKLLQRLLGLDLGSRRVKTQMRLLLLSG